MMPLVLAELGEENTIRRIGGTPEVKKHLADLGFVVGGRVSIISALGRQCDRQCEGISCGD